ncbi:MAG: T9SS type A sorting domain-containing protein [Chitinophagia bacterium]
MASPSASNYNSSSISLTVNDCLQVSNGLAKFMTVGHNEFVNQCIPVIPNLNFNFLVYPNPFKSVINIKSEILLTSTNNILINVFSAVEGKLIFSLPVANQNVLFSGLQIKPNAIAAGSYVLDININNVSHLYKILKID